MPVFTEFLLPGLVLFSPVAAVVNVRVVFPTLRWCRPAKSCSLFLCEVSLGTKAQFAADVHHSFAFSEDCL
jgi:hypothetical protein